MKTVAQFMQDAMYDQQNGYYIVGNPIGRDGDFITAPEISQLFGEMLGIYCADQWLKIGSPEQFILCELGPGRATLMLDLLRATKHVTGFHEAMHLHLVESNQQHIAIQKELIKHNATWHNDIYSLTTDLPLIIIANEFFDCLPIHQYILKAGEWHERYVNERSFCAALVSSELDESLKNDYPTASDGAIIEVCYQAQEIIKYFAKLKANLLIIDYGYEQRSDYISTLQALKNHQYHNIFDDIGKADITAHVDFAALKSVALALGCEVIGSITQREFLSHLGIEIRANILKKNASLKQQEEIDSGQHRLIDPSQMGDLFRVIHISYRSDNNQQ